MSQESDRPLVARSAGRACTAGASHKDRPVPKLFDFALNVGCTFVAKIGSGRYSVANREGAPGAAITTGGMESKNLLLIDAAGNSVGKGRSGRRGVLGSGTSARLNSFGRLSKKTVADGINCGHLEGVVGVSSEARGRVG